MEAGARRGPASMIETVRCEGRRGLGLVGGSQPLLLEGGRAQAFTRHGGPSVPLPVVACGAALGGRQVVRDEVVIMRRSVRGRPAGRRQSAS